jgi:tRNA(adenine34) deaminase
VNPHASWTQADADQMQRALELARHAASLGDVPVGAVVYDTMTGQTLGEGFNRRHVDKDPTAHAELIAIRSAAARTGDWRLGHCSLAVTLEPCPMCAGVIVNARVGRLIYGCTDPKAGACGSLFQLTQDPRLNHRVTPIVGLYAAESAELLRAFFRERRV